MPRSRYPSDPPPGRRTLQGPPACADPAAQLHLYQRLATGDPAAPSELADIFLNWLSQKLQQSFPNADPHLVETVAVDTILRLPEQPARFDPNRGELHRFLLMDARGDLLNALRTMRRRQQREVGLEVVALRGGAGNMLQTPGVEEQDDDARMAALLADFTPQERTVVELMRDGERRTHVYATALGLQALPPEEQAHEVKRWKDRIKKRLRRRLEREQCDD